MTDTPFPLEGGRARDGGGAAHSPKGRPAKGSVIRARRFRKEPTVAERLLWEALRKQKMNFRRQVPIGRFIADFAHHESKLLIEIDGYYHTVEGAAERDALRTAWLESEGFRVVRFAEKQGREDLWTVIDSVVALVRADQGRTVAAPLSPPSPALPPSKGEGR